MQHKPEEEKVAMVGGSSTPGGQVVWLTDDPQVERARKIFLILVGVYLGLCLISLFLLVGLLFAFSSMTGSITAGQAYKIVQALVTILFLVYGFIVGYKYSTIGLRVFGWIGIVLLVLAGIGILAIFVIAIKALTSAHRLEENLRAIAITGAVVTLVFVILYVLFFIYVVVIIIFAFKLARRIDANKRLVVPQM